MAVAVYTKTGAKSSSKVSLPKSVFGVKDASHDLLKDVYVAGKANTRSAIATTKTRAAVRGGGRKPWRQKGTGRARAGTIRSPLWRGGGIIFGPDAHRSFGRATNKRVRHQALVQALSLAAGSDRVAVIDNIQTSGKTKEVADLLKKIDFTRGLVVVDTITPELKRAIANISDVNLQSAHILSAGDVLDAHRLLLVKGALEVLSARTEAVK